MYCDLAYAYCDLAHAYCDLVHAYCDLAHAYSDLVHAYSDLAHANSDLAHANSDLAHANSDLAHAYSDLACAYFPHKWRNFMKISTSQIWLDFFETAHKWKPHHWKPHEPRTCCIFTVMVLWNRTGHLHKIHPNLSYFQQSYVFKEYNDSVGRGTTVLIYRKFPFTYYFQNSLHYKN